MKVAIKIRGKSFIYKKTNATNQLDAADEAMKLGCNLLALGNERVIVPEHCNKIRKQLKAEGLDVITVELDMFTLGGGGVHCLTQPLNRAPST